MTKARTLADMISDGVIGTTELADDVITPVKLDETGNYTMAQLSVDGIAQIRGVTVKDSGGTTKGYVQGDGDGLLIASDGSNDITFDLNASERMRLDASGNLLVGKTSPNGNTVGGEIRATGQVFATASSNTPMYIRRKGDNGGEMIGFENSNGAIGSIRVTGSQDNIISVHSSTTTDSCGLGFYAGNTVRPVGNDGTDRDALVDLGRSATRFKDLYLSGGISVDAPSGNTANVIKASANNTRATLEITGKTSAGTSVRGIVGSYGDASKVDIGTLSGHAVTFLSNNQERARIDIDGRLLVGKTGSSHSIEGGAMFEDGRVYSTVDSQFTFTANRLNSDGEIIRIQKNTSTVGSIVVFDGDNVGFLSGVNNHGGIICGTSSIVPALSGTYSNGATDIGSNTSLWRDVYLSGGIQFDSRSSKLDDYEEGTWTPSFSSEIGTISYNQRQGRYTKTGNIVTANFWINWTSISGNGSYNVKITGLPFTSVNQITSVRDVGEILGAGYEGIPIQSSDRHNAGGYVNSNTTDAVPRFSGGGVSEISLSGAYSTGGGYYYGTIIYFAQ